MLSSNDIRQDILIFSLAETSINLCAFKENCFYSFVQEIGQNGKISGILGRRCDRTIKIGFGNDAGSNQKGREGNIRMGEFAAALAKFDR